MATCKSLSQSSGMDIN